MIYFDNAATTGHKPTQVINAVNNALKNLSANPGRSGHKLSQNAAFKVYETRDKTAEFFNCDGAEKVVFTQNCTASINYVLKGVLNSNDHIIVSDLEHNAVMRPLKSMNISYTIAEVSLEDDSQTVKNFLNAVNKNTKMIFCTAASNVLGKMPPLEKIGALCKKHGLLFGVDAAQGAGVFNIDMEKMNIDYLCVAPHKGFYAPMGLGVLIAKGPIKRTLIEGGTGTDSFSFLQPDTLPEMLESGTVNLPAIAGLSAGIDFVNSRKNNIFEYENMLVKKLYKGLSQNSDIVLYTNPSKGGYAPVLSFNIKDIPSEKTAAYLSERGFALRAGLHCAPVAHQKIGTTKTGTVRFSPSVFNTDKEVDLLLKNVNFFKKYY